jgi:hypothetical protein
MHSYPVLSNCDLVDHYLRGNQVGFCHKSQISINYACEVVSTLVMGCLPITAVVPGIQGYCRRE